MMRVVKLPLRRVIVEIVGWELVATGRHKQSICGVSAATMRRGGVRPSSHACAGW